MSMTIRPAGDATPAPVPGPNAVPLSDRVSQEGARPAWPAPEREDERKARVSDALQLAMNVPVPVPLPPLPVPLTVAADPPLLASSLLLGVRSREAGSAGVAPVQTDAQALAAAAQAQGLATRGAPPAPDAAVGTARPMPPPLAAVPAARPVAEHDAAGQGSAPREAPLAASAPAAASPGQSGAAAPGADPRNAQAPAAPRGDVPAQGRTSEHSAARAEDAAVKPTTGTPTAAAAQPMPTAPPAPAVAPETPQLEHLAQARRSAATTTTRQHAKAVQQAQATQNVQLAVREAASQVNVAFHSWGVGHTVTARMEGSRVLLQPSSVRVGQALAEAVAPVEGDLQLAVEAVEDARDERRRRRREETP